MYIYTKTMYQAWCQGQSEQEILHGYDSFIRMSSKAMAMKEPEMLDYLKKTEWFLYPKLDYSENVNLGYN